MYHLVHGWVMMNPKPFKPVTKGCHTHTRNINLWARLMNAAHDIAPDLVDPSEPLKRPEGIVTRSFCGLTGLAPTTSLLQMLVLFEQIYLMRSLFRKKATVV